jgi:hypothetical protein
MIRTWIKLHADYIKKKVSQVSSVVISNIFSINKWIFDPRFD